MEGNLFMSMKVKIKKGAMISQDFRVRSWPNCFPPDGGKEADVNLVFEATWSKYGWWNCVRPGYGELRGWYGSGSIFVHDKNGVVLL